MERPGGTARLPSRWRVGDVVDGRYEVLRRHTNGGMGLVYQVRHLVWDVDLAVKCPRPELLRSQEDREEFLTEAETWVSLGLHPHVCSCHYVRALGDEVCVFAEYVAGRSDVFSFAVSVLEMYTGEIVWAAGPVAGATLEGVVIWDAVAGRRLRTLDEYEQGVTSLALTPDGHFVLSGHASGHLRLWELDWDLAAPETPQADRRDG
ncbi:hypothetical protein [Streptomyces sp. NPDC046685]|uniref:protein kinase family protein n=1 Tax=Streptomyces sp. NPDC046685 TaxID=3157202 RepID=UPI0033DD4E7D